MKKFLTEEENQVKQKIKTEERHMPVILLCVKVNRNRYLDILDYNQVSPFFYFFYF